MFRKAPPFRFQYTWLSLALCFPDRAAYSTRSPVHLSTIYNPAAYCIDLGAKENQRPHRGHPNLTPIHSPQAAP